MPTGARKIRADPQGEFPQLDQKQGQDGKKDASPQDLFPLPRILCPGQKDPRRVADDQRKGKKNKERDLAQAELIIEKKAACQEEDITEFPGNDIVKRQHGQNDDIIIKGSISHWAAPSSKILTGLL